MDKIIVSALFLTTLITGCIGIASYQVTAPNIKDIKSPELNVLVTSSLGARMLESGKVTTVNGFKLYNDVAIFDGVVKADEYHQIGVNGNLKVFAPKRGYGTGIENARGYPSPAKPYVDGNTGKLCFFGGSGTHFCSDEVKPNITKINIYAADSFMKELIYTGKVGEKIRFTYREFQYDMARQSFNVDVEYDLSESNMISYKGATVEIISATNQKIEYKVLKHFN